jgi:hypothetical protein
MFRYASSHLNQSHAVLTVAPVATYHTGAGLNTATLTTDMSSAALGFYNATDPSATYQEFGGASFPRGMFLYKAPAYIYWQVKHLPHTSLRA